MKRLVQVCSLVLLVVAMGGVLMPLGAQQAGTPFDEPTHALGTFIRTNLGPLLVMVLLIVGFLGMGIALHSGPAVIMGLVIVMIMVIGISSALNGSAISWLGLTPIP
jgi:hypothetical protein